jgi:hypothetical protein
VGFGEAPDEAHKKNRAAQLDGQRERGQRRDATQAAEPPDRLGGRGVTASSAIAWSSASRRVFVCSIAS